MAAPSLLAGIAEPFGALFSRGAEVARGWNAIRVGMFVLVVWCGATMMCPPPADPDLWGHVQYGRDAIRDGLATETTYAYSVEGYPWVNHENLTELISAATIDTVGPVGLLIGKFLLAVALLLAVAWRCFKSGAGQVVTSVVVILVAWNLAVFWSPRPQLATFVCYAVALGILHYAFTGWEGKWHLPWPKRRSNENGEEAEPLTYEVRRLKALWALPLVMVVWTNSHGGWVAGACILVAYLSLRAFEAICRKGRDAEGLAKRLALMIAAVCLATLINPYGADLHAWFAGWLGRSRGEIVEWLPPSLFDRDFLGFFLTVPLFAVAVVFSRRERDFTHLVILAITLWQSLEHLRHIPFFALAFAFWMPGHLQDVLNRVTELGPRYVAPTAISRGFAATLALGFAIVAGTLGWKTWERLHDLPVPRAHYPVSAFEFMEANDLGGKMIVTYNWSQYAIAAFCVPREDFPASSVQFDGRLCTCYPQEVIDLHYDLILGPPTPDRTRSAALPNYAPALALAYRTPDLVVLNRGQEDSVRNLQANAAEWALLYQDRLAQVWGRRTVFDDPASPRYLTPERRIVGDAEQSGSVSWPALPQDRVAADAPVAAASRPPRSLASVSP